MTDAVVPSRARQAMQQTLVNAIAALQAFGLTLPAPPPTLSSSLYGSTHAKGTKETACARK